MLRFLFEWGFWGWGFKCFAAHIWKFSLHYTHILCTQYYIDSSYIYSTYIDIVIDAGVVTEDKIIEIPNKARHKIQSNLPVLDAAVIPVPLVIN